MDQDGLVMFFAKALKNLCPTGYLGTMRARELELTNALRSILF